MDRLSCNRNVMLELESLSCIVLMVDFLQVGPNDSCSLEGPKIEDNVGINRTYDPCHDLSIFYLSFGVVILLCIFVRSRLAAINMTLKIFAFDKYLELECPS